MPPRKRARAASSRRATSHRLVPLLRHALAGLRWGLPLWTLLALVVGGVAIARAYIGDSSAFTVQRIHEPAVADWHRTVTLERLPLLQVNVAAVASELHRANPQMKSITVTRRWPADVVIAAIPRRPVAQLRLHDFFSLDEEGFIFATGTPTPQPILPIIEGAEPVGQRLTPGTIAAAPRVQLALRLLTAFRAAPSLREESVALVNVTDAHQITFRLQRGVEVRMGDAEEVPKTLERLGPVLAKLTRDHLTPQYIDLRFVDPVIGPQ